MAQSAGHDALDQRVAAALHIDIIPGTEVMRDMADVHYLHARGSDGAVYAHLGQSDRTVSLTFLSVLCHTLPHLLTTL